MPPHLSRRLLGLARVAVVAAALAVIWLGAHEVRQALGARAPSRSVAVRSPHPAAVPLRRTLADTNGDDAIYDGDVTVPDGSIFRPGQQFTKIWRIKNIGQRAWLPSYRWHFEAGSPLSSVLSVPVPLTAPGASADLSVPMTAPTSTGVYTSFWQMANADGHIFGHQAWVRIQVRGTLRPTTLAPTPSPAVPSPTPAAPTQAPAPTQQVQTPQPTLVIPGGAGQMVASPWVGALTYRTYFAAGSTANNMHEALSIYYPGRGVAHVTVTLYRPDAARRILLFALSGGELRILRLNRIAPGTGLAIAVEADRLVGVTRQATTSSGILGEPGAARTARTWFFPAIPAGAPADQVLQLFNPHDQAATVTVRVGLPSGGCCASLATISVPPLEQFSYRLGAATTLRGPLTLSASSVVAVERLAVTPDWNSVATFPGAVAGAQTWYLPEVRTDNGGTTVALFNPGTRPVQAMLRLALDEGPGAWQQRSVPAFGEVHISLAGMTAATAAAAEVSATGPIVVTAYRTVGAAQPSAYLGAPQSATRWSIVGGYAGSGYSETLVMLNPDNRAATVTLRVGQPGGHGTSWTVSMPPHSRYARPLTGLWPAGGGALTLQATLPIAAGSTLAGQGGSSATFTGAMLPSS